jgi:hypothetical protein
MNDGMCKLSVYETALGQHIVHLVICSLDQCVPCQLLKNTVDMQLNGKTKWTRIEGANGLPETIKPSPRVFPTVIAYLDLVPRLGWEGFSNLHPSEGCYEEVLDILEQSEGLLTIDEPSTDPTKDKHGAVV